MPPGSELRASLLKEGLCSDRCSIFLNGEQLQSARSGQTLVAANSSDKTRRVTVTVVKDAVNIQPTYRLLLDWDVTY